MNVVVGTPISRHGSYIVDKFLDNQKEIQQSYPSAELILATNEPDSVRELEDRLSFWKLRGTVLPYEVSKPDYARSNIWNITSGREAVRKYTLSKTDALYLLFLDADMTFDPAVISIMEREAQGYDIVFSGYPLRRYGIGLAGAGCVMLARNVLERIQFKCYEFKNGQVIFEDNVLEMDLYKLGSRVKKGLFIAITHYTDATDSRYIAPQNLGLLRKITNCPFARYMLIKTSIMAQYNIPWNLKTFLNRFSDI